MIQIWNDPETKTRLVHNSGSSSGSAGTYQHHLVPVDLEAASKAGCPICCKLYSWTTRDPTPWNHKGLRFEIEIHQYGCCWLSLFITKSSRWSSLPIKDFKLCCIPTDVPRNAGEIYRHDDEKFSPCGPYHTGDEESLNIARHWFTNLHQAPRNVRKDHDPNFYLPRLLDVTGTSVRLIDCTSERPRLGLFATLSHCWGNNPTHLTLTSQNLASFHHRIKEEQLPPSFKDAIIATRSIGIPYIWIDSLCIIQSGEGHIQDWSVHIRLMTEIYSNSALNIVALRGSNSSAGCFAKRDPEARRPMSLKMRQRVFRDRDGA
jgi:hypothetical protein